MKHKRIISFIVVVATVFLLTGCGVSDAQTDAGKAHNWRILDAQGEEVRTISDEASVEEIDNLLCGEGVDWEKLSADVPDDPLYTYVYMQERTLLAGEDPDTEREYEEVMRYTISASEDVVTCEILKDLNDSLPLSSEIDWDGLLTFSVSVPAETAATLREG